MKKKRFAFVTALCCLTSAAALPVSAEFAVLPDGTWVDVTTSPFAGIMIETDGTELTADMVSSVEGFVSLETHDEFSQHYCWGHYVTNIEPENTAYMLSTENSSPEELTRLGRELMMELDCITDVHLVEQSLYNYPRVTHTFTVKTTDPDIAVNETNFPEFAGASVSGSDGSYMVTLPQATANELLETYTQYELYCYYEKFADALTEKYTDLLEDVSPLYKIDEAALSSSTEYSASSVWNSAGDFDGSGAVDSSDAADILLYSATLGADSQMPLTTAQQNAGDLNFDGVVDVIDAANVLVYSAQKGTGHEPDWFDILKS